MAKPPNGSDLTLLLKGLGRVGSAVIERRAKEMNKVWSNSSVKPLAEKSVASFQEAISSPSLQNVSKNFSEAVDRLSVVGESIRAYVTTSAEGYKRDDEFVYPETSDEFLAEGNVGEMLKMAHAAETTKSTSIDTRVMDGLCGTEDRETKLEDLDSLADLPGASTAQGLGQAAWETRSEISKHIRQFEPIVVSAMTAAATPTEARGEITDDQMEAIAERLAELQQSEHKQDFKVAQEIEKSKNRKNEPPTSVDSNSMPPSSPPSAPTSSPTSVSSSPTSPYSSSSVLASSALSPPVVSTVTSSTEFSQSIAVADDFPVNGSLKSCLDASLEAAIAPPQATMADSRSENQSQTKSMPKLIGRKPLAKTKAVSTLAAEAQARKVPHSRLGRMLSFGGLAAGLGMGTLAEMTRRTIGVTRSSNSGALLDASPFLTEANAKRIVDTLCRVRGAALKLGQMLSIQDNTMINPQLQKIFERVRQSADFMPTWQLERTLIMDFGDDWRSLVASFDDKPFAAASIGQVHQAILHDGRSVAMKIQYPGVAEGIESDINNLITTLSIANILPQGLYIDSVIEVAKRELSWECDYVREKECTNRFKGLIQGHSEFYVPEVIDELCTQQVFTTELIEGIAVDKCVSLDQETRNFIGGLILKLCLMELFQFGFMQTDPNWANFFYNRDTQQLALLDFGACREYRKEFVDKYIHVIHGASMKDREKVYHYSKDLGFLTGYEAKVMVDAHIDAVMILGEAFQHDEPFWFGKQDTTHRIQHLVPLMLSHRMCPPPEEIYSLHRKISGVFLLCAKLNASVNCKPFFDQVWGQYKFGGNWESFR